MKPKAKAQDLPKVNLPTVTKEEVEARMPKTAAIFFRLTKADKIAIDEAASKLRLSTAEYLLKSHEIISGKLDR